MSSSMLLETLTNNETHLFQFCFDSTLYAANNIFYAIGLDIDDNISLYVSFKSYDLAEDQRTQWLYIMSVLIS